MTVPLEFESFNKGVPVILKLNEELEPGTILTLKVIGKPVHGEVYALYQGLPPKIYTGTEKATGTRPGDEIVVPFDIIAPNDGWMAVKTATTVIEGDPDGVTLSDDLGEVRVLLNKPGDYKLRVTATGAYGSDFDEVDLHCDYPPPEVLGMPETGAITVAENGKADFMIGYLAEEGDKVEVSVKSTNPTTSVQLTGNVITVFGNNTGFGNVVVTAKGKDGSTTASLSVHVVEPFFSNPVPAVMMEVGETRQFGLGFGLCGTDEVPGSYGDGVSTSDAVVFMKGEARGVFQLTAMAVGESLITYSVYTPTGALLIEHVMSVRVLAAEPEEGIVEANPDQQVPLTTELQGSYVFDGNVHLTPGQTTYVVLVPQWNTTLAMLPLPTEWSVEVERNSTMLYAVVSESADEWNKLVLSAARDVYPGTQLTCTYQAKFGGGTYTTAFVVKFVEPGL